MTSLSVTSDVGYQAWQYEMAIKRLKGSPAAVIDNLELICRWPCLEGNEKLHKQLTSLLIKGMPVAEHSLTKLLTDIEPLNSDQDAEEREYALMDFFHRHICALQEGGFPVALSNDFNRRFVQLKLKYS